jgi:hypothetical protein
MPRARQPSAHYYRQMVRKIRRLASTPRSGTIRFELLQIVELSERIAHRVERDASAPSGIDTALIERPHTLPPLRRLEVKKAENASIGWPRPGPPAGQRPQPVDALAKECAALPDLDRRSPDEIIGYDENGLWT